MSAYDLIIEKNINKGYYKPRASIKNNLNLTLDDVLYDKKNKDSYIHKSKYIQKYDIKNEDDKKKINKNNKDILLKYINQQVNKINEDMAFL